MDETAADYRLHDYYSVLQPAVQGSRTPSKDRKKKGGIKVHTVIHANEGVPSDIKFTSAATNDSFMLKPTTLSKGDIMAMDRAYIDYEKFQQLTERGVTYVTKDEEEPEIQYIVRTLCIRLLTD